MYEKPTTNFCECFYRCPSWPTPLINNLDLISSVPVTSPPSLLSLTPVSTRSTNKARFWSFNSSPLRLKKPPPKSPQLQQTPQPPSVLAVGKAAQTPNNKNTSSNTFRFPPWSGPSPRAVSSPGLLPVTPDSPTAR